MLAGNIGRAGRFEFSVIGDAVNVAARVEAATRQTGDTVLVSQHTSALLSTDTALDPRSDVKLTGKTAEVALFAPVISAASRRA